MVMALMGDGQQHDLLSHPHRGVAGAAYDVAAFWAGRVLGQPSLPGVQPPLLADWCAPALPAPRAQPAVTLPPHASPQLRARTCPPAPPSPQV